MIQEIIINGLINGSIYALLAIGFSLIFGVARIVNIAHTALYMTAACLIYMGLARFGLPLFGHSGLDPAHNHTGTDLVSTIH
jgi:branched-chain amino acid transport system permease protein